mgnify:FL=1
MKNPINLKAYFLLLPILLIPVFGSIALGLILCLALGLSILIILQRNIGTEPTPLKLTGLIFISYFSYFSIQGLFFCSSVQQHVHDIGKILPVLIIGVLLILIKKYTFKISYKAISSMAISSIFLTSSLAIIFRYYPPDINILGETFVQKTGVMAQLEMGTGNALPFGTIFITLAFVTCVGIDKKSIWGKLISFSALILAVLIVGFWNNSRGPLLAVIPLTLLMFWYLTIKCKVNESWSLLVMGLTTMTTLTLLFVIIQNIGYDVSTDMVNGLKEIAFQGSHDTSVNIRLTIYQAAVNAFITKPLFGFGIGNVFSSVIDYLPETKSFGYSHLHNMFLNHAIAGGVFGLMLLLLLIGSPLIMLWQSKTKITDESLYLSLVLVITICGTGMSNVLFMHDLLAGFFCSLILVNGVAEVDNKSKKLLF